MLLRLEGNLPNVQSRAKRAKSRGYSFSKTQRTAPMW